MDSYLQPSTLIPILIAVILIGIYFIYSKYFKKKDKIQGENEIAIEHGPVNARIYDNLTGTVYNAKIPGDEAQKIIATFGSLGRKWDRYGKKLYAINKTQDGKGNTVYQPVPIPDSIKNSPRSLHDDIQHPEVAIIYGESMKEDKSFADKWGKLIWWIAVMGIIIWLMMSS
jgi:hypothetical protein